MTNLVARISDWWRRLEERKLATLSPDQRADILAFDRSVKRHKWRYTGGVLGVWLIASTVFRFVAKNASWLESLTLMFLLFGATGFAMMSVWFGHSKFRATWRTSLIVIALAMTGAVFGGMIGRYYKVGTLDGMFDEMGGVGSRVLMGGLIAGIIYAALLLGVLFLRRRTLQARNVELQRQAESERVARQLADARLKLMQAQVEPHFLFNTLASVQQLAEGRAPEAANLTRELIAFLRHGLIGLREDTTTLKREFDMSAAFLAIMKTRMGERLTYSVSLPEDIADDSVPPAMLISLVENAIKHGIEPATGGGSIAIHAVVAADGTHLVVTDTGMGLGHAAPGGGGVGLANVRERLAAIYGEAARLEIRENVPRGVVAEIVIPRAMAAPSEASVGENLSCRSELCLKS